MKIVASHVSPTRTIQSLKPGEVFAAPGYPNYFMRTLDLPMESGTMIAISLVSGAFLSSSQDRLPATVYPDAELHLEP